ncbi:hypothetical protein [sulfur-oxidizing endosymbiont of Gigantopelta aegis]|uniref:hypothetical protein n=1 Tax=sulfur-oxidizing endosymbiont of Gigantopelta aegis TaxID=2794934 RepID=UPI0018DB5267|nr:hypothetical protein [sulfur-oxidizing endosymbiont of Gigantopelta aegis]
MKQPKKIFRKLSGKVLTHQNMCSIQGKKPEHWAFNNIHFHPDYPYFGEQSLLQNTPKKGWSYDPGRLGLANGLYGAGASGWETDKLSRSAPKRLLYYCEWYE